MMLEKLTTENEKLKTMVSSLEKKIGETEEMFEETNKISEERFFISLFFDVLAWPYVVSCWLYIYQDEKSCPYFMRTGSCKFGVACKFHHPHPASTGAGLSVNGLKGLSVLPPTGVPYAGGFPTWPLLLAPFVSGLCLQTQSYMPLVVSPSQNIIPAIGWSTYMMLLSFTSASSYPERPDEPECTGKLYVLATVCTGQRADLITLIWDIVIIMLPLSLPLPVFDASLLTCQRMSPTVHLSEAPLSSRLPEWARHTNPGKQETPELGN
ncbi:hypothetical protein V6N12_053910 [Hibiscus sabdariffa]|uniref:C3H1-type domain-containing protein n=1 Tax=Hibiscus sabdariffa TaxID=183260 RepID=A0ABR2D8Y8_9ROSI